MKSFSKGIFFCSFLMSDSCNKSCRKKLEDSSAGCPSGSLIHVLINEMVLLICSQDENNIYMEQMVLKCHALRILREDWLLHFMQRDSQVHPPKFIYMFLWYMEK